MLEKLGLSPDRLHVEYVSAAEGVKFAEIVKQITAQMGALGKDKIKAENEKMHSTLENMLKKRTEQPAQTVPKPNAAPVVVSSVPGE
jgi:hypothetical protein